MFRRTAWPRVERLLRRVFREQTVSMVETDLRLFLRRRAQPRAVGEKPHARFLNVGAGPHGLETPDWFNVDGFNRRADMLCDATRPLPFPDKRFDGVFTEHMLEHLTTPEAVGFLKECRRVLTPGGVLRIVVPDGALYLRNYFDDRAWMLARRKGQFRTPMEVVNEAARQTYEHQYLYDYETLELRLRDSGFSSVRRFGFREGSSPEALRVDRQERAFESMYVEAVP